MWLYYFAQCSLHKILSGVHPDLHIAQNLDEYLESWKRLLPAELQWNDNDPPSEDINAARLQANYYRVKYIIHRPFVDLAILGTMSVMADDVL